MKVTREGIWFKNYGYPLLWYWPWSSSRFKGSWFDPKTRSVYSNRHDFWYTKGRIEEAAFKEKMLGFTDDQVFFEWAEDKFRNQIVLILRNVNVEQKPITFWNSIPPNSIRVLSSDYSVLFFGDLHKALDVAKSIPLDFAETFVFYHGKLQHTNYISDEFNT